MNDQPISDAPDHDQPDVNSTPDLDASPSESDAKPAVTASDSPESSTPVPTPANAKPKSTTTYNHGAPVAETGKAAVKIRDRWDNADPASRKKLLIACVAALAALMVGLLVLLFLRGGEEGAIAKGTRVAGIDVGGMTEAEATQVLNERLLPQSKKPLLVKVDDRTQQITPAQAGLAVDIAATVKEAMKDPGAFHLGSREVPPVVREDKKKLTALSKQLADGFNREANEGGITFQKVHNAQGGQTAKAVMAQPQTGIDVDVSESAEAIKKGYLATDDSEAFKQDAIELPAKVTKPKVSLEQVVQAFTQQAEPAVAGPVTFQAAGRQVSVAALDFVPLLGFERNADSGLALTVSGPLLARQIEPGLGLGTQKPVDATFVVDNGRPKLVSGRPGLAIDEKALTVSTVRALTQSDPAQRVVAVTQSQQEPKVTTQQLEQLGIKEQVASFDQRYTYAAYRVHNLSLAASYINGTIVKPGQVFSLNGTTNPDNTGKGYVEGGVIADGKFSKDIGGGLSTMATTMWTVAFYGGFERVEQRAHSLYIPRYQAGLEATIDWGSLDMRWKNDSSTAVFITSQAYDDHVNVTLWGTKRYEIKAVSGPRRNVVKPPVIHQIIKVPTPGTAVKEEDQCRPQAGVEGFDITVVRQFFPAGGGPLIKEQPLDTHYDPTPEIICDPPGTKPTPTTTTPSSSPVVTPRKPGRG